VKAGAVREPYVDVRRSIVEPTTGGSRQTGGETTDRRLVAGPHVNTLEARTAVDVHLVGPVHEDVCDTWFSEQAVEGSSTQGLATQGFDDGEYDGVAVHTAIGP